MGMSRSATMGFGNQIPLPCSYSTCMACIYTEEVWALLANEIHLSGWVS